MKKFAFAVALMLLAVALPASAAETSSAAPLMTPIQQIESPVQPILMGPVLIPYCSTVQGTSCTTVGSTRSCTDACHNQLSCTCTSLHRWNCLIEC